MQYSKLKKACSCWSIPSKDCSISIDPLEVLPTMLFQHMAPAGGARKNL
jgi:hypothetical protein